MNNLNNPLFTLTVAEYLELHKKIASDQSGDIMNAYNSKEKPNNDSDIIFLDDVMTLSGYKRATIYSKVSRFEMPVLSRNKPLTFSRSAIIDWIKAGKPNMLDVEAENHIIKNRL